MGDQSPLSSEFPGFLPELRSIQSPSKLVLNKPYIYLVNIPAPRREPQYMEDVVYSMRAPKARFFCYIGKSYINKYINKYYN